MAEKITVRKELESTPDRDHEHHERISKHYESRTKNSKHEHHENLNEILHTIETTAKNSSEISRDHHANPDPKIDYRNPNFVGKQLKENQLKRSLAKVQKELKPYQRPFSRLIHNDAVEILSDATEKTLARPDGLLMGGLVSLIVSLGILIACRFYGYEYNYFIGIISFPVGFTIGLLGEFILKPLRRK